ncbi:MAG: hypothetical protein IJ075_02720 [Lachnospiraceae bacterium]|nr:hypothetical protein [Lachnospiraceae bacterium]
MEKRQIFREKSIERVTSPEQLDDYIKVTTPSVWLILIATVILLIGTLIWGVTGRIEVNTPNGVETVAPINYVIK